MAHQRTEYALLQRAVLADVVEVLKAGHDVFARPDVPAPEFVLGRKMLIAFLENDGRAFVSYLEPKVQEQFTVEKFRETRERIVRELGEPVSFRYLTTLEMTALKPNIWAVRFKRMNLKNDKEFYQEVLFQVVTAFADGRAHVISFNFK